MEDGGDRRVYWEPKKLHTASLALRRPSEPSGGQKTSLLVFSQKRDVTIFNLQDASEVFWGPKIVTSVFSENWKWLFSASRRPSEGQGTLCVGWPSKHLWGGGSSGHGRQQLQVGGSSPSNATDSVLKFFYCALFIVGPLMEDGGHRRVPHAKVA